MDEGADLIGGDWQICFSQSSTDNVAPCRPVHEVPLQEDWPPPPGAPSRLGSGTGERGTYGPACMWRMSLHTLVSRYPWKLGAGSLIRVVGDTIWWNLLHHFGKSVQRVPFVIGNYFSHPSEQAEFRGESALTELERARDFKLEFV